MKNGRTDGRGMFRRSIKLLQLLLCGLFALEAAAAQSPAPGHRVFGGTVDNQTLMVDASGVVDQFWSSAFGEGFANYVDQDGALLQVVVTDPLPVGGAAGGLQRLALDGTVLWDYRYDGAGRLSHHDIAELPNGNVLMIAWEEKTVGEALQAGRHPNLLDGVFRPDHIIEVRQTGPTTGEIVWEWHVWDHLIQDIDPTRDNFGVVADHPELVDINYPRNIPTLGDWNHTNGIDYDPVYDRIILSPTKLGEIWVIDHSTTTEEAAGHTGGRWGKGGDILYRWGNPEAYGAGTEDDRIFRTQHAPRVIPTGYPGEGNYLVFLNKAPGETNRSAIYELAPPLDDEGAFVLDASGVFGPEEPAWEYSAPGFYSNILSSAERLPNGNTLICSGTQGRVFEVDAEGEIVLTFEGAPDRYFNADYVDRWLWSDRLSLSVSEGGGVTFDLVAGAAYGDMDYLLLGSRSGTEPGIDFGDFVLPLNPDGFLRTARDHPNTAIFEQNAGALDSRGRGQSRFNLTNESPLVPGDIVHFAYLLTDPQSGEVVFISKARPITVLE